MKTIPLDKAFELLCNCTAVIVDDNTVAFPNVADLNGESDNQFLYIGWSLSGVSFNLKFNEACNREVRTIGNTMYLIDDEGDEYELILLIPQQL